MLPETEALLIWRWWCLDDNKFLAREIKIVLKITFDNIPTSLWLWLQHMITIHIINKQNNIERFLNEEFMKVMIRTWNHISTKDSIQVTIFMLSWSHFNVFTIKVWRLNQSKPMFTILDPLCRYFFFQNKTTKHQYLESNMEETSRIWPRRMPC